jgi:hypothetical protein
VSTAKRSSTWGFFNVGDYAGKVLETVKSVEKTIDSAIGITEQEEAATASQSGGIGSAAGQDEVVLILTQDTRLSESEKPSRSDQHALEEPNRNDSSGQANSRVSQSKSSHSESSHSTQAHHSNSASHVEHEQRAERSERSERSELRNEAIPAQSEAKQSKHSSEALSESQPLETEANAQTHVRSVSQGRSESNEPFDRTTAEKDRQIQTLMSQIEVMVNKNIELQKRLDAPDPNKARCNVIV